MEEDLSADVTSSRRHGNAYNFFVLILTVVSLLVMALLLAPLNSETIRLLTFYDNLIAVIFLIDFAVNLNQAPSRKKYFIDERGWLDLLGSIPTFPGVEAAAVFRLARLSRFARITHLLRTQNRRQLVEDIVLHRAHYAVWVTILAAILVLLLASLVVLQAESRADSANIKTGWDALWWSFVTITTVGYGDRYPVTIVGRIAAMFVMVMGVGIIGALASIMASLLLGSGSAEDSDEVPTETADTELASLRQELVGVRSELTALRELVERISGPR
jgi:voltage-gated potassium channel